MFPYTQMHKVLTCVSSKSDTIMIQAEKNFFHPEGISAICKQSKNKATYSAILVTSGWAGIVVSKTILGHT